MYNLPTDVKIPEKAVNFNVFPIEKKEKMIEQSLKLISEGKISVILDASNPFQLAESETPVCTSNLNLNLPIDFSILEFFLNRLKDLGNLAIEKFGKNYEQKREAILAIICLSEGDIDEVEETLLSKNYYGYEGVLCFCTVKKLINFDRMFLLI